MGAMGMEQRSRDSVIPMDALGEPYQRLARHNKLGGAVQATARFLDITAASASHLIRHYPLARLVVFVYVILIHLFVYLLIFKMQRHVLTLHTNSGLPGVGLPSGAAAEAAAAAAGGAAVGGGLP